LRGTSSGTIHTALCLVPGDSKYKVPPLSPLEIKESIIRDRRITLTLTDVKIYGLLDAEIEDIR
jgi:hypothetical protein